MKDRVARIVRWIEVFIGTRFDSRNPDLPYYLTALIAAVIFLVAVSSFVMLTDELAENDLSTFDDRVTDCVTSFRDPGLTRYFTFVTHLGDIYAYLTVGVGLAVWFFYRYRNWKFIAQTVGVLALASLSNVILKEIIHRERPSLEHLVTVNTLSYPSGHSMSAMAFYGFLIYLCLRYKLAAGLRLVTVVVLTLLIVSVGLSRVYLGVHYPSDVLAGWIGGLIWVALCAILFNVVSLWRRRRGNGIEPAIEDPDYRET